ncbi:MAG: choice-of-anchor J domain-containing protein [Crocinitomicaceae bacterium]|nr:choice-of-anchor J domain-containing protein [Crocinitomicaceae bacterium]
MIRLTVISFLLLGSQAIGQTEIYNEDFQSGMPVDYTIVDNDGLTPHASASEHTDAWIIVSDPDNLGDSVASSTSYFDPAGQADRWLITPSISLGAFGNVMYWEGKVHDPSFPDGYYVLISITDTQLSSFIDTMKIINVESEDWVEHSVNLSDSGYNNQNVHLAFVNRTNDGFKLFIDDIRVESEDPVSVDEFTHDAISIYPNPSSDFIHTSGIENITEISVISCDGKIVLSSSDEKIDISHLQNGNYVVVIEGDSQIIRTKFVKN